MMDWSSFFWGVAATLAALFLLEMYRQRNY